MPQVTSPKSDDLKQFIARIPSGTSRSSNTLRRTALHSIQEMRSIQEIHSNTSRTSEILYQTAIRAIEGSYGDTSETERDTEEDIRTEILPTLIEIHELLTWPDGWNGYSARAPKYSAVQYADHWIELFYKDWGANINTEMEDGLANSHSIRLALWKWLMS